jgi:hypothetical protein
MDVEKMNQKGVLFSIMILFIAITFISINAMLTSSQETSLTESRFLSSASNKYDNIDRSMIDFDRVGYNKIASERVLPFSFSLEKDSNKITIEQELPVSTAKIQNLFDFLNMSEIFFEDTNRNNAFDGLAVDLNVPKNSEWGGSTQGVSFLINPLCYEYIVPATGFTLMKRSTKEKCTHSFSSSSIRRIDINITVNSNDDYNLFKCNNASCSQNSFNPSNNQPYYYVQIIDSNCAACAITQKIASSHFDPLTDLNFSLTCSGSNCTSVPLTIKQNNFDFNFIHTFGRSVKVTSQIIFTERPDSFFIPDINAKVASQNSDFSEKR